MLPHNDRCLPLFILALPKTNQKASAISLRLNDMSCGLNKIKLAFGSNRILFLTSPTTIVFNASSLMHVLGKAAINFAGGETQQAMYGVKQKTV